MESLNKYVINLYNKKLYAKLITESLHFLFI